MKRFIEGESRNQSTLFPESLDDYVKEDNPVRVIDVFVDELDLGELGFSRIEPCATGRPAYHPSVLLKLYVYGYMNRIHSSRRLEQESQRNVEVMWLTGRLMPDFKMIAVSSARIMVKRYKAFAVSLLCYAGTSICLLIRWWPLMAVSSKRSMPGIRILPEPR